MSVEQAQGGIGQWLELRSEGMGHLASDLAVAFTTAGYQVRFTEPKQIISPYTRNIHVFVRGLMIACNNYVPVPAGQLGRDSGRNDERRDRFARRLAAAAQRWPTI